MNKHLQQPSQQPSAGFTTDIAMFDVIWSRHTLYHTVDPIAVVEMAITMLKPKGLALLFHVPVKAQRISPAELLNCIENMKKIDIACVEEMPDSPGNFLVFARAKAEEKDFSDAPTKGYSSFASFFDYENKCVSAAGTYTYATLYSRDDSKACHSFQEDKNSHTKGGGGNVHTSLSAEQFLVHACRLHSQFQGGEAAVVPSSNAVYQRGRRRLDYCRCM